MAKTRNLCQYRPLLNVPMAQVFSHPIIVPAQAAVLLLFTSPGRVVPQRATLLAFGQRLQQRFGSQLRLLRIDEVSHPDVVHSFGITQTPTCVLVRQGVELWRQEGLPDETALATLTQQLLIA